MIFKCSFIEQMEADIQSASNVIENARKNVESLRKDLTKLSNELHSVEVRTSKLLSYK